MKKKFTAILRFLPFFVVIFFASKANAQNACNPGRIYDQIQSGFHTTIATRPNGTYTIWGELSAANGTGNNLSPVDITPANGYGYTGTPLFASLGSSSQNSVQMILMTTTGMYAWGTTGRVLQTAMKNTTAFGTIPMPIGITPAMIKQMVATNGAVAIVTTTGEVWVAGTELNLHGAGATLPGAGTNYWAQVTTNAGGNPALTGVTELRISPKGALALTTSGTWYTWGVQSFLGNGSALGTRNRATPMTVPFAGTPTVIALTSCNNGTSYFAVNPADNKIYAMGANQYGQLGRNNTTDQTGWVIVQNPTNTGDLTDVMLISGNDQDGFNGGLGTVGAITSTERLYLWGSNAGPGMGGGSTGDGTQFLLPRSPNGFTFGTDVPLYVEVGGHTSAYLKECADRYCYIGHKVNGSMGDGLTTNTFLSSFDCINTPQALICGASSFDGGDAPVSYENSQAAAHYYRCPPGILLGSVGPTSNNGTPGNVAPQANNMGSLGDGLEEDGVTSLAPYLSAGTYSFSVNAINTSGSAGFIYAWVDWDGDGIFETSEYQTTGLPNAVGTQTFTLTWNSIPAVTCGKKYVRIRVTNDVFTDNGATAIDERSIGATIGGEVEDYFVQANPTVSAGPDQNFGCNVSGASCGTTLAATGLGVWSAHPGNPGTATIVTPTLNTTAVNNFSAPGAYRFIFTSGTCVDTMLITFNVKPNAINDAVSTPEDTPIVINVLGNDTDFDNNINPGTVNILTGPSNGSTSINIGTGAITYTPTANFNGVNTIIYRVCDLGTPILCDTATVTITVNAVNDPPLAVNDVNTTNEDTPVSGNVFTNDNTTDGPGNNFAVLGPVTGGGVVLNPTTGAYTFTPTANFNGTASFNYTLCDGFVTPSACDTATVTITVNPINDAPVAIIDIRTTPEDTPIAIDVLTNDNSIDGGLVPNTVVVGTAPTNGSVSINNITGVITYTPNANFTGTDTFIYQVCDAGIPLPALCDTALVRITITSVNDAPIAVNDVNTTNEDTPVTGNVFTNDNTTDGPSNNFAVLGAVTGGGVVLNPTTGAYTFTPTANFNGTASFNYTLCDGFVSPSLCDTATVTITVNAVNDAPVAVIDVRTTPEDTPIAIDVLTNDVSIDGGLVPSTVVVGTAPANGSVSINNITGVITYTPNANFTGTDTFIYQVCDNGIPLPALCDTALVRITVTAVNDAPIANNDVNTTNEDTPVSGNVFTNDLSIDGPSTLFTVLGPVTGGGVVLNPTTGAYTFTPTANFNGTASFSYTLCDGFVSPSLCDTAIVTITVNAVNDAPVAVIDVRTTPEDTPIAIDVLTNDVSIDGGLVPSTVVVGTAPANGSVSINNITGVITYTPNANFTGTDTFIYQVCDNGIPLPALCDTALVRITVTAVNDAPIANNDVNTTNEDTPVSGNVFTNDLSIDGPSTLFTVLGPVTGGGVVLNATTGAYTFTPTANFNGTASFSYTLCDGFVSPSLCDTAIVTITVNAVNDAPVANLDVTTTPEDTPVAISILTNDVSIDGGLNPASITIVTPPTNGSVFVNTLTGVVTYTPNANYNGSDAFIYQVCDAGIPLPALCDTAVVRITVTAVNDAPIAINDVNTTNEDTPVTGNVFTNDNTTDGPSNNFAVLGPVTGGGVVLNPTTGAYTFTPTANFNGTATFTYTLCDGGTPNLCDTATVTITVNPVNDGPIVNANTATTSEDTPVVINVLPNDTDIDGVLVPNTVASVTLPANGTISINAGTGAITYTPNANFNGTDSFIYTACDNGTPLPSLCDTAVVTITVTPVNDPPVANNDTNSGNEDSPITGNVSTNDNTTDGPGATYTLIGSPTGGSVVITPGTGAYTFTPTANFNGTATFSYSLCDGGTPNLCDTATVTITINPINDGPIVNANSATTSEDTPVVINVLPNDTDIDGTIVPNTVASVTLPANGTISINAGTGAITYTPNANFNGTDSFIYTACDNGTPLPSLCDTAVVTVTVTPVNDPPVANNDTNTGTEDAPISGNVSTNDNMTDGPGATYTLVGIPTGGSVVITPGTGAYTFTPTPNFYGTGTFTYSLCDGGAPNLCDTATVTITINPVNDGPIANANTTTTPEDTPVAIPVLGNDSDIDGSLVPSTVSVGVPPTNGTVNINTITGVITYTPNANFVGTDSFIYQVCDNGTPLPALCDTAVVTVTVTAQNDPPVAVNDVNTTNEDTPASGNVAPNDSDLDGPGATYTVIPGADNGTLVLNTNGTYTYTPDPNFNGTDVYTYQLCDGGTPNLCDTATLTITVLPVNDAPIAINDTTTTPEDVPVFTFVLGNDSDIDGVLQTNSVAIVTPPAHGTISINAGTGVITYTPTLDYNGTDSYSYIVCDNGTPLPALCDTAVVFITITPVNDPVAVTVTPIVTNEDTPTGTICYPINDDPTDDHTVTICGVTNGSVVPTINNGTDQLCVVYTPNANYYGSDDICLVICDNGLPVPDCDTIHIPVTVLPINDAPIANADNVTTNEDTPVVITVMGNDTDIDAVLVPNTVAIGTPPANGTVNVNLVSGQITYTPNANFTGTDTFIYQVCDNGTPLPALCDTAVVTIIVAPVNDPPVATNDINTTNEDTPINGNVSTNDNTTDGPTATYTVLGTPTNGSVILNPTTGTYTFTPTANANGTGTFTYTLCDGAGLCDTATVTITINPINDAPIVNANNATTNEDTPVVINVLPNDTDIDGTIVPNSVAMATLPLHGSVTINALTGEITYTPTANYNGTDSFIYTACDNGTPLPSLCDTAVVTITINPVNDPPVATNDTYVINEDATIVGGTVGTNDNGTDGPTTVFAVLTPSSNGTVTFTNTSTGVFNFTPNANYNGVTTFTYTLCDAGTPNFCDTATVTITVLPINDAPIVNADAATTPEDTPISVSVLGNDTDTETLMNPSTVVVLSGPTNGSVSINGVTGVITYTPNANFNGTDSYIYQACDNGTPLPALCDTAVVTITVTPVNDAPIANNDVNTTNEDTPVSGNVFTNDNTTDGPSNNFTVLGPVTGGSVVLNPTTGTYTFTPTANFNGTGTFTYTLCDGFVAPSLCDTAVVTITVVPVNDPPVIDFPDVNTPEDVPVTVCSPITDPDAAQTFTATLCNTPANGTVTGPTVFGGQVCITYTPTANFNGIDSVCVILCDQNGACDTSTTVITVTPVNDPPIAVNDVNSTNEDTPVSGTVATNDNLTDGPGATYTLVTGTSNGSIILNTDGTYTYTPSTNFFGTDIFTYSLCDGGTPNLCSTATVIITVVPVNDAPIVNANSATTNEDTPVTIAVLGNDTDVDGILTPNSVATVSLPANGTVSVNASTGVITYTPNANFSGTDSFIYIACDNGFPLPSLCDTAVVTINVLPVNDPIVANNDNASTPEDVPVVINVPANDTDPDNNINLTSVTVTSAPTNGSTSVNPINGQVTYTPNTNFTGVDVFTYQICDTGTPIYCATATVTITVTPVNDPPVINLPDVSTPEETPVTICSPITDPDAGQTFSATLCGGPNSGTVSGPTVFNGQVCITYTPSSNFNGLDSICVIVCDQNGACDTSTTVITVTPVNDPPIAVNDNYTTAEDVPLTANVSSNDNATDGPTSVYTVLSSTTNGTLTLNPTGTFTYTPNANYTGSDVFTYRLCDGGAPSLCDTATVFINITPVNDPPVINIPDVSTPEETPVTVCSPITDPDANQTFTAGLCGGPMNGTVSGPTVFNGQVCITYTPNTNFVGVDSICVILCDQNGLCDTSTTVITVTPINDPPIANGDVATTTTGTPVTIPVVNNDTDVDGAINPTTVTIITPPGPGQGTATVNPGTGVITYTPGANTCGTVTFIYRVCDTGTPLPSLCDTAVVTVTVTDTQAPAITCPANFTTNATSGQCGFTVTGTALNATATENCGAVTLTHNYTAWPNPNSLQGATFPVGTTAVTWTATDAAGNTSSCTFNVTVNDNQAPTFLNCPGGIITLTVFGSNCQGSATWPTPIATDNCSGVTVTQTGGPLLGTSLPVGLYVITYTATDASGNTATCSFSILVINTQTPSIVCPGNSFTVNTDPGVCSWTSPAGSLTPLQAASNCSNTTVTWTVQNPDGTTVSGTNDVSGYAFAKGTSTVTYTITSTSTSQTASCSFTVTVVDNQNPTFVGCPINITVGNTPGSCGAIVNWVAPTATDNCPGVTVTSTHAPGATFPVGTTTVTYTATDAVGRTATCSFTVTVNDTQAPVINGGAGCPANITLTSNPGICGAVATWTVPTVTDNCAGAVLTSSHNSGATFAVGTTTVTYTATDAAGNISTCSFTVTVTDTQAPSFVNCPTNITVSNFFNTCYEQVWWPTVIATDNCGSNGLTITTTHSPGFVFPVGVTPVTYTVVDLAGNSTTCSFTVTVNDTQMPTIQGCPPNVTVNNTPGPCGAVVNWAVPTVFDNCPGVTLISSHASGSTFPIGTTTVTYTATDAAGNVVTCSFNVTVNDVQAPVIAGCPTNMVVSNSVGLCGAIVNWTAPTATDNCPGVVLTSSHTPGATFPLGVTTVTYTATDASGNTATCSFTVIVNDTQAPVITGCPANINVNSAAGSCGAVVNWVIPTIVDNCPGVVISATHTPGSTFSVGTTTVTYTATDAAGNTSVCSFNVVVTDNTAPVITGCPTNITVNNSFNLCGAPVFWTPPTITDNCSGMTVTSTQTPGTVFPIGTTTVTYTATDISGNVSTCSFTVTVIDAQAPQITGCPANISINSTPLCTSNVTWTVPSAFDNCPGVTLTSTHAPGTPFPPGTTTVTYTATDASGNTSTCSFTVTVTDGLPPTIVNCPTNIVTTTSPGICGRIVTWTAPTITDNCSVPTVVVSHTSGSVFPKGVTTVTYTATDAAGNVSTCSFTVTVTDNEAPTIVNCPANMTVVSGASCSAVVNWTAPTATDNCPGVTFTSTHTSGSTFPVGVTTVTYTATDAVGNVSTCTFTVTVNDTQAPVVSGCPANITIIDQFNTCGAPVSWTVPTFTDNCPTGMTVVASHTSGTYFPAGTTTVTYTATDISGNVTVCSFTVTIVDQQVPQIVSCPINATLNSNPGICGAVHNWVLPVALDNCPGVVLTTTHAPGSIFPVGTTNVVYTATDVSGNTATCTFSVTVIDNELPVITGCPSDITVSNTVGNCDGIATWTAPVGTDNCNVGFTFTSTHNSGDVFPVGTTTVIYTATDAAGNVTTCSFDVTVNDTELPVITGCPSDITLNNTAGICEATATWTAPIATDNCSSGFTFTSNYNSGDIFPVGTTTVVYTATDNAGNITTCSFDITVNDAELPVITGCPANINSCTDTITWTAPTASDNCGVTSFTSNYNSGDIFPVGTTTVIYTATDSAGNVTTCSFNVTVSMPTLTVVSTNVTCFGLNNGTATVIVNDAVGPFTFNWGAAGTDSLLTNLTPGTYTVVVNDGIGCSATASVTITQPQVFDVMAGPITTATCGMQDGQADVFVTGGTTPYSFSWTNGQTSQSLYSVEDGVYSLTATDANGCSDTLTVTINCVFGKVPQLLTPNGDGHNDTWFIPGIDHYPNATVEVYNRWGNLVLKSSPYLNDWAGVSKGMLNVGNDKLPAGTYFYVIKLTPSSDAMTGYLELQY